MHRHLATNLVEEDTNGEGDVFVRDRQTGETTLVGEVEYNSNDVDSLLLLPPIISADGRFVAYEYSLLFGHVSEEGINVYDRQTGETTPVKGIIGGLGDISPDGYTSRAGCPSS